MLTMPLSPVPAAVPDLGSTVMIAALDPFAIAALAAVLALCLGFAWRASRAARPAPQRRRPAQIRPIRQSA